MSKIEPKPSTVKFTLDGHEVEARADETIWQVANRHGTDIPHLCYSPEPGYRADGNCRACMVEIEGERVLAASCIRKPTNGMKVITGSDRAKTARQRANISRHDREQSAQPSGCRGPGHDVGGIARRNENEGIRDAVGNVVEHLARGRAFSAFDGDETV